MINLNHDIAEVEMILQALGTQAHDKVAMLIAKIRGQAIPQVQAIQAASVVAATPAQDDTPVVLGTPKVTAEQNVA